MQFKALCSLSMLCRADAAEVVCWTAAVFVISLSTLVATNEFRMGQTVELRKRKIEFYLWH